MAMNIGSGGDEDEITSTINTTPLVDVMLVLLIIFLITVPVVTTSTNGVTLISAIGTCGTPPFTRPDLPSGGRGTRSRRWRCCR